MKPYDLPVELARARIDSPELYPFGSSDASLVRSAPVTLVPFLRVSVPPSPRRTLAAAALPYLAMITHELVIGYPHGVKRSGHFWAMRLEGGSGQRDQIGQVGA